MAIGRILMGRGCKGRSVAAVRKGRDGTDMLLRAKCATSRVSIERPVKPASRLTWEVTRRYKRPGDMRFGPGAEFGFKRITALGTSCSSTLGAGGSTVGSSGVIGFCGAGCKF